MEEEMDKLDRLYAYRKKRCKVCKHPMFAHTNAFNSVYFECVVCFCKFYKNEVYQIEVVGVEI